MTNSQILDLERVVVAIDTPELDRELEERARQRLEAMNAGNDVAKAALISPWGYVFIAHMLSEGMSPVTIAEEYMRMGFGATSAASAVQSGLSGLEFIRGFGQLRFFERERKLFTLAYALKKEGYSDREIIDGTLNAIVYGNVPLGAESKHLLHVRDTLQEELPKGTDALREKAFATRQELFTALRGEQNYWTRLTPQEALEMSVRKLSEEMGAHLTYQDCDFNGTIIRAQVSSGDRHAGFSGTMHAGFSGTIALSIDPLRGVIGAAVYVGAYPGQAGGEFERTMLWRTGGNGNWAVILEAVRQYIDKMPNLFNYPVIERADERQIQFLGLKPRPDGAFLLMKSQSPAYRSAAGQ